MTEKIYLDNLSDINVIVVTKIYTKEGYLVTENRTGYTNTLSGRIEVETKVQEPYKSVIFMMWGENPTVIEENI